MSGHSKWANIKHKKEKGDAAKSNIFTKIGREIAIAVKQGGPDPNNNSRLKDVIDKAKRNNMPNDNITRSIKKASGELSAVNYEELIYEGYGAGGVAVIIEALTDNKNRTGGDVRHIFDKCGGSLGTSGCVSYMFDKKGVIIIDKEGLNEDDVMLQAIEAGALDVVTDSDVFEVYTTPSDLLEIKTTFEKAGFKILSDEVERIPNNTVDLDKETEVKILRMLDLFDENDDIQNVYHNAVLSNNEEE